MQMRNVIAGSQTELGSPAADLRVTYSEKKSLFGQMESKLMLVSLHQG